MVYDAKLAEKVWQKLAKPGLEEKKMFGGVVFLKKGKILAGVTHNNLLVRIDPDEQAALLRQPGAGPFEMKPNQPAKGWLLIAPAGLKTDQDLDFWLEKSHIGFAKSAASPRARHS